MQMSPPRLKEFASHRFTQQMPVLSLWQELAENFYPERANFLRTHSVGEELADNLASSQPILIRRELANSFEGMLRDGEWFKIGIEGEPDHDGRMWLDWASKRLLKYMEVRSSGFRRATKEADNDYVTFGNAVMSIEMNRQYNGLLFRTWNMRDVAWWDDDQGNVAGCIRKWNAPLHEAASYFGVENLHPKDQETFKKHPFETTELIHFDMPSALYGDDELNARFPRVSLWLDVKNEKELELHGANTYKYIVPRFQTLSGSPYAYSPATVVGLPDARTLQAMTHTLLEAGERHARPPIIAVENVIRGDANLYPDGITFVSEDYDERSGVALRPLTQDAKGFPFGLEMREGIVEVLQSAFYINKIGLPETTHEMTAYEVQERMKQYRRENLPLFAPIEHNYSGAMCELSFDLMMANGFLGSPEDIPQSLQGQDIVFKFESPLSAAEEEKKVQQFNVVADMLARAAELDPGVMGNVDFGQSLRDAVQGTGAPESWLRSVEDAEETRKAMDQQIAAQEQEQAA